MPPTPFHPTHTTPFKSSLSSSQQQRQRTGTEDQSISQTSDDWPPALQASQLDSRHWTYLAEGGKNLLLKYVGPEAAPYVHEDGRRLALRLTKTRRESDGSGPSIPEEDEQIDPVEWQDAILRADLRDVGDWSLLPPLLRVQGTHEEIKPFVRQMAAKIEPIRPAARRRVTGIDEERVKAISVTEDLSASPAGTSSLVFEIKPKCGFLPKSELLNVDTQRYKRKRSRFRMHSVHKASELSLEQYNELYDPLHLYDDCAEGQIKASKELYSSWQKGRGNNLRVFLDGKKVDPEHDDASFKAAQEVAAQMCTDTANDSLFSALAQALGSSQVRIALAKLRDLQQRYDPIDVEGIDQLCQREYGKGLESVELESFTLAFYQDVVQKMSLVSPGEVPVELSVRELIAAFLLSTMYKDCSLFIRVTLRSGHADTCVHLVDLDPKPVSKLPYLYRIDQEIVASFAAWAKTAGLND